jgi:phospholipid/cholesterol/gamma-HCH transport system substrate-binding protein
MWWKNCRHVKIQVDDATGLKSKSQVRSLGVNIGYLNTVALQGNNVLIGLCLTAPVDVIPETKAFIRSDGLLGDKFIEIKPVRNLQSMVQSYLFVPFAILSWSLSPFICDAQAESSSEAISVSHHHVTDPNSGTIQAESGSDLNQLMNRVDSLVEEVTKVASNIKNAINPEDIHKTLGKLNVALENISKTVAPDGGLNQTAQRSLLKLENAIEQVQAIVTRINKGEGSVGMLINDPTYAVEIKRAIDNLNKLLDKVSRIRFVIDIMGNYITQYNGVRAGVNIGIWTRPERYYLLGIGSDPRGDVFRTQNTTTIGTSTQTVSTRTTEYNDALFTAMIGKVFQKRLDLSLGLLFGYGTASLMLNLGPQDDPCSLQLRSDFYYLQQVDARLTLSYFLSDTLYLKGGMESFRRSPDTHRPVFTFGLGINFDDEDLKLLLALK